MNQRPSIIVWWEDLHVGVQVAAAYVVSLLILWIAHIGLLNQPTGRAFVYAIFWAVPATVVIVLGTRTERARRLRADERDPRAR